MPAPCLQGHQAAARREGVRPSGLEELKQYARSQQHQQNGNGHPPPPSDGNGNSSDGLVSNKIAEGADVKTPLVRSPMASGSSQIIPICILHVELLRCRTSCIAA
jgi:hypothetical protein